MGEHSRDHSPTCLCGDEPVEPGKQAREGSLQKDKAMAVGELRPLRVVTSRGCASSKGGGEMAEDGVITAVDRGRVEPGGHGWRRGGRGEGG